MRILCVHDDAQVLEKLRRMLLEREPDWQVRLVSSAEAALAAVAEWQPDAVAVGARPPVLDAVDVLGRIRDQRPETVRVLLGARANADAELRALKIAHRALPEGWDAALFVESIRRAILLRDLVAQPPLRALLGTIGPLPAAPMVYSELTRRLDDPTCSVMVLGEIVSEDPALAAQVLRFANSAYFGREKGVTRLNDAAARLGTRLLRSLVLTAEVYGRFPTSPSITHSIEELQRHSALVARIASSLEPRAAWKDDAFTAGLLHDVGRLILVSRVPELHQQIEQAAIETGRPQHEVELERLGAHHGSLGACLLGMWGLPSVILEAVHAHHDIALEIPHSLNAVRAVALADRLAHDVLDDESARERREPLPISILTDPRWSWWREMADQVAHEGSAV